METRGSVGKDTREWRNGEMLLFDTSLLHEAENTAPRMRYILMLRVWHPDLSPAEVRPSPAPAPSRPATAGCRAGRRASWRHATMAQPVRGALRRPAPTLHRAGGRDPLHLRGARHARDRGARPPRARAGDLGPGPAVQPRPCPARPVRALRAPIARARAGAGVWALTHARGAVPRSGRPRRRWGAREAA